MSNVNNNFLEDEDEIESMIEESYSQDQEVHVLGEAMKRIEQAKLYEALLKHDLFSPDSARPEIIDAVKKEFKDFILSRLELLLGIRHESNIETVSQFSDDEVQALKALANRLVNPKKSPNQTPTPHINTITAPTSTSPIINPIRQPQVQAKSPPKPKAPRKRTANVSEVTGQEYSQAGNPKALPMPSQAEMDNMNARLAQLNSGQGGTSQISQILGLAIANAQTQNKNVVEE